MHTAFVGGGLGLGGLVLLFLTVQGPGGGLSAGSPPDPRPSLTVDASPADPTMGDGAGGADGGNGNGGNTTPAGPTVDPTVEGTDRPGTNVPPSGDGGEPAPSPTSGPVTWDPFFEGAVTLDAVPLDFDLAPPMPGSVADAVASVADGTVYVGVGRDQVLAKAAPGSGVSSPEDCVELSWETVPMPYRVSVSAGDRVCLVTDEDRVALLRVTAASAQAGTVVASAEVWERAAD